MQIRHYHREFYRPENLHIIITGQVEAEDVFAALESVQQKILSKVRRNQLIYDYESMGADNLFFPKQIIGRIGPFTIVLDTRTCEGVENVVRSEGGA